MSKLDEYRKAKAHLAAVQVAMTWRFTFEAQLESCCVHVRCYLADHNQGTMDQDVFRTLVAAVGIALPDIKDRAILLAEAQMQDALKAAETEAQEVLETLSRIKSRKGREPDSFKVGQKKE